MKWKKQTKIILNKRLFINNIKMLILYNKNFAFKKIKNDILIFRLY